MRITPLLGILLIASQAACSASHESQADTVVATAHAHSPQEVRLIRDSVALAAQGISVSLSEQDSIMAARADSVSFAQRSRSKMPYQSCIAQIRPDMDSVSRAAIKAACERSKK